MRCNWSMDDDPGEAQGSGRKQKEAEGSRREGSGLVSGSWRKSGVRNQRSNECETVSGVRCADHGVRCALCAVRCALCAVRCVPGRIGSSVCSSARMVPHAHMSTGEE